MMMAKIYGLDQAKPGDHVHCVVAIEQNKKEKEKNVISRVEIKECAQIYTVTLGNPASEVSKRYLKEKIVFIRLRRKQRGERKKERRKREREKERKRRMASIPPSFNMEFKV